MSQLPDAIRQRFDDLVKLALEDQAKWFLNGFWDEVEGDKEEIWNVIQTFKKLLRDAHPGKTDGDALPTSLDEFYSHKLLEMHGETMTVIAFRETMRKIDLDFDKHMAPAEYLAYKYDKTAEQLVNAPQGGDNKAELDEATRMVEDAQAKLNVVMAKLEESQAATAAAIESERVSTEAEAAAVAAEEANKAALAELQAQEKAYADKIADLERKSEEGGLVSRNRAKNELAQVKGEDPLPLRRAKLNQEATVRKAEKARAEATARLEDAKKARASAEEAERAVEAAVAEAQKALDEANAYLDEIRKKPGQSYGSLWWLSRELEEQAKYMPRNKRTVKKPAGIEG